AWKPSPEEELKRRSVYMMTKRHLLLPLMTAFDFPNSEKPCGKRDVTTVAPQALALLNNPFVHKRSESLAARILTQLDEPKDQIEQAWTHILQRLPSDIERAQASRHLEEQRASFEEKSSAKRKHLPLASLCHVLLNTNEFVYVD
ncbi:MAG: hypothetical protein ACI8T1_002971, partial [Verrucomicrobiales bacterium]